MAARTLADMPTAGTYFGSGVISRHPNERARQQRLPTKAALMRENKEQEAAGQRGTPSNRERKEYSIARHDHSLRSEADTHLTSAAYEIGCDGPQASDNEPRC
jgi:hypothetical protein